MIRKFLYRFIYFPIAIAITSQAGLLSETNNYIDEVLNEKKEKIFITYDEIEEIIFNNEEIKSLKELVIASSFNLSSKISQKYPSLDLQASGLPKYVAGKNYNSNTQTLKTSQFSANPSLNIRWDLINPVRDSEIKIAKESYQISKNNLEIKSKDLIKEARMRFHNYQKSFQEINNKKFAVKLSNTSLNNAKSKLDTGTGTKFEVLEADAQLSRDKQSLNEKKIEHEINKLLLK